MSREYCTCSETHERADHMEVGPDCGKCWLCFCEGKRCPGFVAAPNQIPPGTHENPCCDSFEIGDSCHCECNQKEYILKEKLHLIDHVLNGLLREIYDKYADNKIPGLENKLEKLREVIQS